MTALALLFTLSAIGISETVYLIRTRLAMQKPVCIIGQDCTTVLESKYNRIFVVLHNDEAGLLFYVASLLVTAWLVLNVGNPSPIAVAVARLFGLGLIGGSVFSLCLVYLQWRVIRAWCFWCVMSACTIWLMTAIMGFHFLTT